MKRRLKCHGATEAQLETQLDEFGGLLLAAIEGVGNTAPAAIRRHQFTQMFQQFIRRPTHVKNHGQAMFSGQFELCPIEKFLPLAHHGALQLGQKIIQSDFTHSDQTRIRFSSDQFGIERLDILLPCVGDRHRMDSQCVAVRKRLRQHPHRFKVANADGRQHAMANADGAGPGADIGHVVRKLGGIQVAVRVNPESHGGGRNWDSVAMLAYKNQWQVFGWIYRSVW